jgi:YidC/Oxa1 family membrane protein insertase
MDRRTTLAITLFAALYFTWMTLRPAPEVPPEGEAPVVAPAAVPGAPAAPAPGAAPATAGAVAAVDVPFEACGAVGTLNTRDGLRGLTLPEHEGALAVQPLYSWVFSLVAGPGGPWKPWGDPPGPEQVLTPQGRVLAVGAGPFATGPATLAVVSSKPGELVMEGRAGELDVRHSLTEVRDEAAGTCVIDVRTRWTNRGAVPVTEPLWVMAHDVLTPPGGSSMFGGYDSVTQPLLHVDGALAYGNGEGAKVGGCMGVGGVEPEQPGAPVAIEGPVDWFGLGDRYFGFLIVPDTDGGVGHFSTTSPPGQEQRVAGSHLSFMPTLAPGASHDASMRAYVGPLKGNALTTVEPTLANAVDLGFFAFFGYPLLWLLRIYYGLTANWGLAIILLTVTVKLLFFPMTQSSFRSMQNMQRIQPEMNRIKEQYADNPQEMNRLTMDLMIREKVNPLSGCLPMLAQTPVWIALYNVLLSSVDLYHTDFLYLRDLSAPDPYCVLPVLVIILMLVQQQFTNMSNMDPAQARLMKIMPLMFGVLFFTFPSGLALYMFVNMLGSILQQWWIKRSLGEYPAQAVM